MKKSTQVNLVTKCGLKRFRAARSAPQSAPGAAASAVASTADAEQASPVAAVAASLKARKACDARLGCNVRSRCFGAQSEEPAPTAPGDLVMPLKFRAPPSGVHLLQVRGHPCDVWAQQLTSPVP